MTAIIGLILLGVWVFFFGYFAGLARGRKKPNDLNVIVTHRHESNEGESWKEN